MSDGAKVPHVVMLLRNPYTHDSRVEKEAAALRDAGYRVTIVADAGAGLPEGEERDGARVIRVPRRGARLPGLSFLLHEWRLAGALARVRADIFHAHDSNALLPVAVASRRTGRPFVYDAHDLWLHRPRRQRSRVYHALQNGYYGLIERAIVPRAAAVITVSPPIARHLERRYGLDAVDLVPNYPDRPNGAVIRELRALPGMAGVPPTAPIVLYLGGLMGGRGIEYLVRSMTAVPDAHLVLLGSGHQAAELEDEARAIGVADRVHVLQPVPSNEVVGYATSATVGVSPIVDSCLNYRYSLPNKLFQYMAAGLPVVASDFPQVRAVVVGSGAGLVTDTRSPERIADALSSLLADRDAAREMGERGRAAVEARYNWSTSAAVLLDVYRRVAARPPSG